MDIGIKLLPVMCVHSKIHPLLIKYSNGTNTLCYAYLPVSELVSCAFSTIPIYLSLFKFTCVQALCNTVGNGQREYK